MDKDEILIVIKTAQHHAIVLARAAFLLVASLFLALFILTKGLSFPVFVVSLAMGMAAAAFVYAAVYFTRGVKAVGIGWVMEEKEDSDEDEEDDVIIEHRTTPTSPPTSMLRQIEDRIDSDLFDSIDWEMLSEYVTTTTNPEFSREVLVPNGVPYFSYSPRGDTDTSQKFPDAMMELGFCMPYQNGYRWTGRGVTLMESIYAGFGRISPSPTVEMPRSNMAMTPGNGGPLQSVTVSYTP